MHQNIEGQPTAEFKAAEIVPAYPNPKQLDQEEVPPYLGGSVIAFLAVFAFLYKYWQPLFNNYWKNH